MKPIGFSTTPFNMVLTSSENASESTLEFGAKNSAVTLIIRYLLLIVECV